MRLKDLLESSALAPEVKNTISPTMVMPDLVNSDTYKQYRYSLALAAARAVKNGDVPFDAESAWNESLAAVAYTDADQETIEMANKLMKVNGVMLSDTKSCEPDDTNTVSPVAKFTMFDNMNESVTDIAAIRNVLNEIQDSEE